MKTPHTTLYRDKQKGKLMGVCAGIADYTGINAFWIRIGVVLALCLPPISPIVVPAYFLAGIFLPKRPDDLYVDHDEQKYWQRVRQSPTRTAHEVRARFRDLDRRLAEVETYYVTSNPRLSAEIERLR